MQAGRRSAMISTEKLRAIGLVGTVLAVGARFNDGNGDDSGHVRVFGFRPSTGWTQIGNDVDGEAAGDYFGRSVSLSADGTVLAIGAEWNDGINGSNSGHVRVFRQSDSAAGWTQIGNDIDGEAAGDESGWSVSLSSDGTRLAVGAPNNDGNGVGSGHVRVYDIDLDCSPQVPTTSAPTSTPPASIPPSSTVQTDFVGISIEFIDVDELTERDIVFFARITEEWFDTFFEKNVDSVVVHDMASRVSFTGQKALAASVSDDRPYPVNAIFFDQTISYIASENALSPEQYLILPFLSLDDNTDYGRRLAESIDAFRNVQTPIANPKIPTEKSGGNDGRLSTNTLVGIIVAVVVLVALIALIIAGLIVQNIRKRSGHKNREQVSPEPSHPAHSLHGPTGAAEAETVEAVPVNNVSGSPSQLPTFENQAEDVHHGPQLPPVARFLPERRGPADNGLIAQAMNPPMSEMETPSHLPDYKDQTRSVHYGPQAPPVAHALSEDQELEAKAIADDSKFLPDA